MGRGDGDSAEQLSFSLINGQPKSGFYQAQQNIDAFSDKVFELFDSDEWTNNLYHDIRADFDDGENLIVRIEELREAVMPRESECEERYDIHTYKVEQLRKDGRDFIEYGEELVRARNMSDPKDSREDSGGMLIELGEMLQQQAQERQRLIEFPSADRPLPDHSESLLAKHLDQAFTQLDDLNYYSKEMSDVLNDIRMDAVDYNDEAAIESADFALLRNHFPTLEPQKVWKYRNALAKYSGYPEDFVFTGDGEETLRQQKSESRQAKSESERDWFFT